MRILSRFLLLAARLHPTAPVIGRSVDRAPAAGGSCQIFASSRRCHRQRRPANERAATAAALHVVAAKKAEVISRPSRPDPEHKRAGSLALAISCAKLSYLL